MLASGERITGWVHEFAAVAASADTVTMESDD
jgi:hypothetical protein